MCKYNFIEFIAALEGDDFNVINPDNLLWAEDFIQAYDGKWSTLRHNGDCIGWSQPCTICTIEQYFEEYREYCLNEKEWREKNKTMSCNQFTWDDDKVIKFVNWYIELHKLSPGYGLENKTILESFKAGDKVGRWRPNIKKNLVDEPEEIKTKRVVVTSISIQPNHFEHRKSLCFEVSYEGYDDFSDYENERGRFDAVKFMTDVMENKIMLVPQK
jgi:hypothetical protein